MENMLFSYALTAENPDLLPVLLKKLRQMIEEHAKRHDFAQMVHVEDIHTGTVDLGGNTAETAILVPFHRDHFRELVTLNQYMRERATEIGLALRGLILPAGAGIIPFA